MRNFVFALLSLGLAVAQAQKAPEFDAVSVKVDNGNFIVGVSGSAKGGPGTNDPGRFTYTQQRLEPIVMFAYDVMSDQISGSAWLEDAQADRFTITATMPPDTTKEQFHLMLQNLLAERFHLAVRHETKDFPGYDLVVAPGGPKMKLWTPDASADAVPAGAGPRDEQGFPRLPPGQPGVRTSLTNASNFMLRSTHRQSMADFALRVGPFINISSGMPMSAPKPRVSDKTGLSGIYEFKIEFEAHSNAPAGSPFAPPPDAAANAPDPGGPTVFEALEKQLGLKLVKSKGVPVDVMVIEHADKVPTGN
jgi:uncharacterized protein (TIGR03435 family)